MLLTWPPVYQRLVLPAFGLCRTLRTPLRLALPRRRLTLLQAGVPPDLDVAHQRVAHRAALIRLLDGIAEVLGFHARHPTPDIQIYACDSHVLYVEGAHGADLQPLGRRAALGQDVRERHRKARAVGGGDELLRAGFALRALGSRGPGDGHFPHRFAAHRELAASL